MILLTFIEFSKVALINVIVILMMSANLATPGLFRVSAYVERQVMTSMMPPRKYCHVTQTIFRYGYMTKVR